MLALTMAATGTPALAVDLPVEDPPAAYAQCMDLARTRPRQGFEVAVTWQGLGGGEAARHCAAVALLGLGQHAEAATRLETLAQGSRQPLPLRLDLLAQAATAWMLARDPARADAVLTTALEIADRSGAEARALVPDLLIDRATARAAAGAVLQAARDLDRVLDAQPNNLEARALRASALRQAGSLAAAEADAAAVLAADPTHAGALLETGNIQRLSGRPDQARATWLRLLEVAPEAPEAQAARDNLAALDVPAEN
ncbi:hypothetical protein [Roseospira visakhapatnamensis]|uniref:Tetratricopeptide (TPR) repeat protein n=1 Tax=Roseospira visakhapatnamensis TaxID=390880 RepID=A0A7W6RAL7_9PROT|nr:hypothetical protein [Roseospira visakhapatnamensis]MBB4264967.1 tetratricopeptide (TPR) repeat protein [Roseospira visakhapatnamensis]